MRKKKVLCIASSKVVDSRKLHHARFCCWVPCFSLPQVDSIANKTGKCLFHCFSYEFRSHSAGFVRILEEFKLFYPNFSLMVFCSFVSDAQLSLFFFGLTAEGVCMKTYQRIHVNDVFHKAMKLQIVWGEHLVQRIRVNCIF